MPLIVISNRAEDDWKKLCGFIGNVRQSSVIALDNNCKSIKFLDNNIVGILPDIIFIRQDTDHFTTIFSSMEVGEDHLYVAVHDSASINNEHNPPIPPVKSLLYDLKNEIKDFIDKTDIMFVAFNHTPGNKVWSMIDELINNIINDDHSGVVSAKSDILNVFAEIKKERRLAEDKFSINDALLPLAAYDLLMQTAITDQRFQNIVKEDAKHSLQNLERRFADIVNHDDFDFDNYNEKFHFSLKRLSSELLK